MERRTFLACFGSFGTAATYAGWGTPSLAADAPKPIGKVAITSKRESGEVIVYQSRNKGALIGVYRTKEGKPRWVEFTARSGDIRDFALREKSVLELGDETIVVLSNTDGSAELQDGKGTLIASAEPIAYEAILVVAAVVTAIGVLALLYYSGPGEEAKEGMEKVSETIAEATGDGFWNDGSDFCNPGPLSPPALC